MALQKQNVPLSLNQGLNTKFDPKQLPFGSFTNVENIRFDKEHEFNKRYGYDELSSFGVSDTSLQTVIGIAQFQSQPLWISRDQIYSYSSAQDRWQQEGSYDSCIPTSIPIVQNGFEQTNVEVAIALGYEIYIYYQGSTPKMTIKDQTSGSFVLYNETIPTIAATTSRMKLTVFQEVVYIFYVDSSNQLKAETFNLIGFLKEGLTFVSGTFTTVQNEGSTSAVLATLGGQYYYDVVSSDTTLIMAYHDNTLNYMKFDRINLDFATLGATDPFTGGTETYRPQNGLDMHLMDSGAFGISIIDENNKVKFGAVTNQNLVNVPISVIEDISTISGATGGVNVTSRSVDGVSLDVFYQVYQTNPFVYSISTGTAAVSTVVTDRYTWNQYYVRRNTFNLVTQVAGTAATVAKGVGLAGKAFTIDQNNYIPVIRESELNSCYYVMKADGSIQSKISQGGAGPLVNSIRKRADVSTAFYNYSGTNTNAIYSIASLPNIISLSSEKFLIPSYIQGKIVSGASGTTSYFSLYGINSSVIDFSNEIVNQTESLGNNLHFSGGQLKAYDGNVIVEENFNYGPEAMTLTPNAIGTGTSNPFQNPGVGTTLTWSYYAIYTWTDAQGNIHRSGLSLQASDELVGSGTGTPVGGWDYMTVRIPTLNLTQKNNTYIDLYRTLASGTVFYKVYSNNSNTLIQTFAPFQNQKAQDYIEVIDITSDTNLAAQEIIYTTGGVLENISPPSSSIVTSFKNRLFLAGLENKLEIRYSKLLQEKVGVEFNDSLFILVSQVGGNIIALKAMDDKLIIFKDNAIFYLAGDGPNNLGQQDSFIEPQLISSDVGCTIRNSVTLTPQGLFFKSNKGIYLLSRSLGLDYIGAPVEDFNHLNIVKGDLVPKSNEVRFLTSDGPCLVYNYFRGFWSIYTSHKGFGSIMVGDTYYYVNTEGAGNRLYRQNYNSYLDGGTPINMVVETGWMNPVAAQNSIRVYRMLLLGNYFSPHKVKVSVAYDYNDDYVESSLVDVTSYTEAWDFGDPGTSASSTGTMVEGYYGDPGGTTGDYTTSIAYGGKDVMQYQIRVDFKKQKCEAMKLKIESLQSGGQNGQGVSFSQLLFVAGSRGTEYKIKQSRIFKTT